MIQKLLNYLFPPPDVQRLSASRPRSPRWRAVRAAHVAAHPTCEVCGTRDNLECHHVLPYHLFPSEELADSNLLSMCNRCHLFVGHCGEWRAWNPSVRADVETWRRKFEERSYDVA